MNLINIMHDNDLTNEEKLALINKATKRDINQITKYFTPIMMAVYNQNFDFVEALFKKGADAWIIEPYSGKNYVNLWASAFNGYEYWEDLEKGIYLFAQYAAWKKPEWCEVFIKLIFEKGWPKAADYLSGNINNMRNYN